jgi:CTLH/CRA C-terminal to LisH motif domain/LisH
MTLVKTDDPVSDLFEGLPSPDQESVHQLIYDYLIHNCYGDTAQSFRQSCGSFNTKPHSYVKTMDIDPSDQVDASGYFDEEAMDIDASQSMIIDRPSSTPGPTSTAVKTLGARKTLHNFIIAGSIVDAIDYCDQAFPNLLNDSENSMSFDVLFALRCQQFIECIKQSAPNALEFAQKGNWF